MKDKISNVIKNVIIYGIILFLTCGFIEWILNSVRDQNSITPEAITTSSRNAFVSGCKSNQDTDIFTAEQIEAYCQCACDKMIEMNPNFLTDEPNIKRIIKSGLTQEETDTLVQCIPEV